MGQTSVYECDKRTWLRICLWFLLLACVLAACAWFLVFLPRQFAVFFAGLLLFFAVLYVATAVLGLLLAYSCYEVRDGRLFLVLPTGAREIEIERDQAPVLVPLIAGKRHLLHIYTRSKRKLLFDVSDHRQFYTEVRRLFARIETRKVLACGEYRGFKNLYVAHLVSGTLLSFLCIAVLILLNPFDVGGYGGSWLVTFFLSALLISLVTSVVSALTLRNAKVVRDGETLSAYNLLGRKTRELKLGAGLYISTRKGFMYLACREGRFRIPLHVAFDKALIYDAFAIAEGGYEFVDSDGSARPQ
ncbi:MAG: hypothetical protein IH945_09425 [Armatimonadetes bacterium]|nr:hypothetical protein [Armatimonadota bacterium]